MATKHRKFMEDDFDLEHYIHEQQKDTWFKTFRDKSQKTIAALRVVIAVIAFAVAYLIFTFVNYNIELWNNNRINETARSISSGVVQAAVTTPPVSSEPARMGFVPITDGIAPSQSVPPTNAPLQSIMDLRSTFGNDDIIGYIKIDGTNIDFPVAIANNNSFYLTHDLRGVTSSTGSAFMDYENHIDPLDPNTVIYAHNMRDGSMFHDLRYYTDKQYYEAHQKISLQTLYENTLWEIFSFYDTDVDFIYNKTSFANPVEFSALLAQMKSKSIYDTGVDVTVDDQVLTLSTCTNTSENMRYVVHAKRIQ